MAVDNTVAKKALASLMGDKGSESAETEQSDEGSLIPAEEGDEGSDLDVAGSEVMEALQSGDAAAFTESLKSFIKLCNYEE